MTADEVFEVVRAAVVTVLEVDPAVVTRSTHLRNDLAADSLALVEIVEIVEESLASQVGPGFHLDDDDLDALTTVGEAVDLVTAQL